MTAGSRTNEQILTDSMPRLANQPIPRMPIIDANNKDDQPARVVAELPKTSSGKVSRKKLVELIQARG